MRSEKSVLIEVKNYLDDLETSLKELAVSVEERHMNRVEACLAVAEESLAEARRVVVLRVSEIGKGEG